MKNYNTRVLSAILGQQTEIVKLMDYHDMITTDTSQSYDVVPHIPVIKPFASLSAEQRNSLVAFYEAFIVQAHPTYGECECYILLIKTYLTWLISNRRNK